jgi:acetyl esterase/lipase
MIPEAVVLQRQSQAKREIERMKNGRDRLFREGLREEYDLPYRSDGDGRHTLDLIRPEGEGPFPVVVEIHGGAYVACEKNINRLHSRAFAQQGFAVVNGDYTLHPEGSFRRNMQELADIVKWVGDNAARYSLDAERVYMSGDSAGGHLILLYTMIQSSESIRARFDTELCPIRLRAAAATCPGFRLLYDDTNSDDAAARQVVEMAFPDGVSEEELEELDILRLLPEADYPPLIVTATPGDGLLWREDLILARALEKRGRPFAFRAWESRKNELRHVFNVLFPEYEESRDANEAILAYFRAHDGRRESRVRYYEGLFAELLCALADPAAPKERLRALSDKTGELERYLSSAAWKEDFAADEAGLLPRDLKRGVLSEDGLWNALEEARERLRADE